MQRRSLTLAVLAVAAGAWLSGAAWAGPATGTLRVEIIGLKSSRGDVIFALYNSRKTFTKHAYRTVYRTIHDRKCVWVATDLPVGDYAIVVVHDKNGNHDMDSNFLGIPREPYAFSNNVRAVFGAPSFRDAKVTIRAGTQTTKIDLE